MLVAVALLAAALPGGWQDLSEGGEAPEPEALEPETWVELVELVCLDCHGGARLEADIDLRAALEDPAAHRATWERAYDQVQARSMPPEEPLDAADRAEWIAGVRAVVGDAPGAPRATVRRLTRSQLELVLEDLLGVRIELDRYLARDASAYGFDTTGDTLFVTPLSFETWFEVVDLALERAREEAAVALFDGSRPAAARLGAFAERAFRRPPTPDELRERLELLRGMRAEGFGPEARFDAALRSILLAPGFLYRNEATRPGDGFDAASRLALFLWGRLPDDGLVERARSGELLEGGRLESEALRMLDDPRAGWLAEDFALQWLGISELGDVTPDVRRFRPFNEPLRRSMRAEVVAFFEDLIANDRSVLECLDSDFVFVDGRLAKHYGLEGVKGRKVRRVARGERTERGGVLGMAAVHTITSEPLRTSPVKRGQWVLERLLRSPAPPPPPDAGTLPEDDRQKDGLTLRERLEQHRADPTCASCHARMDPYGFALESFDGIGQLREGVDASAVLPGGAEVDGPGALKAALLADPARFARAFVDQLFVYAVGRPPAIGDHVELEALVERSARGGYRIRELIAGVVGLQAFLETR